MEARRLRKALNDRVGVMATASEARRDSPRESVGLEVLVEKVLDLRRPGMGRSNTLTESELSLINSPENPVAHPPSCPRYLLAAVFLVCSR